ncbi:MAG: hypothetical protein ACYTEQ_03425 [Planctomycetota bacterium]|jgi:hypothetical protein
MKRGTPEHPKMLMLQGKLEVGKCTAVGIMECLWQFTARYAPCGDIGKYANNVIANRLEWEGDADDLINALLDCVWLDPCDDPKIRLICHHWSHHSDPAADKYLSDNGLIYADGSPTRRSRDKSRQVTTSRASHTHTHTQTHTQKKKAFVKPSIEELGEYIREKGLHVDAIAFWNHYEANGWKVGRNPMKSWQAALQTWERREKKEGVADATDDLSEHARRNVIKNGDN